MTDECREAFHVRYGRYPGPLDALAFAMFCAGWNEARRSQPEGCREAFDNWISQFFKDHDGAYPSALETWNAATAWNARRSPDAKNDAVEEAASLFREEDGYLPHRRSNWPRHTCAEGKVMTNCPCCKSANTQAYSCSAAVTHWCRDCSCEWNNERRSPDASEVDAVLSLLENAASVDYDEVVMEAKTRLRALKDRAPDARREVLAVRIARAIFECGDEPALGLLTWRIQFMGGSQHDEKGMGGLNETALACVIAKALRSRP